MGVDLNIEKWGECGHHATPTPHPAGNKKKKKKKWQFISVAEIFGTFRLFPSFFLSWEPNTAQETRKGKALKLFSLSLSRSPLLTHTHFFHLILPHFRYSPFLYMFFVYFFFFGVFDSFHGPE